MKKIATRSGARSALLATRWPGKVSPNGQAPLFPLIAATPDMTGITLTAKHHLETDERRYVIAYILNLK